MPEGRVGPGRRVSSERPCARGIDSVRDEIRPARSRDAVAERSGSVRAAHVRTAGNMSHADPQRRVRAHRRDRNGSRVPGAGRGHGSPRNIRRERRGCVLAPARSGHGSSHGPVSEASVQLDPIGLALTAVQRTTAGLGPCLRQRAAHRIVDANQRLASDWKPERHLAVARCLDHRHMPKFPSRARVPVAV